LRYDDSPNNRARHPTTNQEDAVSFQAYIDNVKAKTGKTPRDFAEFATKNGLTKHSEIVTWLKSDFALGHGHATAIAGVVLKSDAPKVTAAHKMDALFSGKKAGWREHCDKLSGAIVAFGPDVAVAAGGTYINLLRDGKKFAIVQPSSADRLDIGIKLKGKHSSGRFETAGAWNAMVTHRARLGDHTEIDAEVLSWLRDAYQVA
jgi:Domain of unknown function (DUF4287)/Domain of unknown function (DUF5655)